MGIRSQNNDNDAAYYIGAAKSDLSQVPPAFARIQADEDNLDQSKQNQNFDESAGDIAEAAESLHALGFKGLDDLLNPTDTLGEEIDVDAPYGAGAPSSAAQADESEEVDADTGALSSSVAAPLVSGSNENAVPMSMAAGIIMAFLMMIQFANEISQEQNELSAMWARASIGISVATYPPGSKITAGEGTTIVNADGSTDNIPAGTSIAINADGSMTIGNTTYPSGSQLNLGNSSTVTTPDGTESGIPEGSIIVLNNNGGFSTYSTQTLTDASGNKIPGGLAGMWYANGLAAGQEQEKQFDAQATADIVGCVFSGGSLLAGAAGWVKNSLFSGPDADELADAQARQKALSSENPPELHARGNGRDIEMETLGGNAAHQQDIDDRMMKLKAGIDQNFRGKVNGKVNTEEANKNIQAVRQLRSNVDDHAKALKQAQKRLDSLNAEKERGAQAQATWMNFLNIASTAGQTGSKAYADSVAADTSAKQARYKANSDIGQQVFGQTDGARDKASQQAQSQHERAQQSTSQMLSSLQAITASRA